MAERGVRWIQTKPLGASILLLLPTEAEGKPDYRKCSFKHILVLNANSKINTAPHADRIHCGRKLDRIIVDEA